MEIMRLGIHQVKGSFSERWIEYCEEKGIDYKLVDCYKSDIISQLSDCNALLWHYYHNGSKESKFAKQLLYSLQAAGKVVFPDFNTGWHFDDKVGQKYLLEAIDAPIVPSYVFFRKSDAKKWATQTQYPIVFKLRNGAGSDNVRLVKSKSHAFRLINKAFGKGFKQYTAWRNLKERFRKYRHGKSTLWNVIKGILRLFHTTEYARVTDREKGYIYFQEFIPGNDFDIRIIVVGDKAFGIKRMVRKNDFRASGSGFLFYEKSNFNDETVRMVFDVSEKLQAQCLAFDIVYLHEQPLIVEISYGFAKDAYDACTGYWERDLTWHDGTFNPYGWMIDDLINRLK